jgi:betaine-aldehyde dehydrogenase
MTYPTQPTASHFINGQYVEDTGGKPIDVIYPATGEKIGVVYSTSVGLCQGRTKGLGRDVGH